MTKIDWIDDCKRIQSILLSNNIDSTLTECYLAWAEASASWDAQWLNIEDETDEYIFNFLEDYWDLRSKIDDESGV